MRAAEPFDCALCERHMGKSAAHNVLDDGRVVCSRCLGDRRLHGTAYESCPHRWHDLHDHATSVCSTRAGVRGAQAPTSPPTTSSPSSPTSPPTAHVRPGHDDRDVHDDPDPDPPHVTAKRRTPNPTFPGHWLTVIDCPHCGREHVHGDGAGHRVAHCSGPGTDGGYVIDHPAGWKARG